MKILCRVCEPSYTRTRPDHHKHLYAVYKHLSDAEIEPATDSASVTWTTMLKYRQFFYIKTLSTLIINLWPGRSDKVPWIYFLFNYISIYKSHLPMYPEYYVNIFFIIQFLSAKINVNGKWMIVLNLNSLCETGYFFVEIRNKLSWKTNIFLSNIFSSRS